MKILKSKAILMKSELVVKSLAGQKTETRRLSGLDFINEDPDRWIDVVSSNEGSKWSFWNEIDRSITISNPYFAEELWAREFHYRYGLWVPDGISKTGKQKWKFEIEGNEARYEENPPKNIKSGKKSGLGWYSRPSLFMTKDVCRLHLKVKSVHPERLHDIDEDGAISEGIIKTFIKEKRADNNIVVFYDYLRNNLETQAHWFDNPIDSFKTLWISINGQESWGKNPWVWVIKYEKK